MLPLWSVQSPVKIKCFILFKGHFLKLVTGILRVCSLSCCKYVCMVEWMDKSISVVSLWYTDGPTKPQHAFGSSHTECHMQLYNKYVNSPGKKYSVYLWLEIGIFCAVLWDDGYITQYVHIRIEFAWIVNCKLK